MQPSNGQLHACAHAAWGLLDPHVLCPAHEPQTMEQTEGTLLSGTADMGRTSAGTAAAGGADAGAAAASAADSTCLAEAASPPAPKLQHPAQSNHGQAGRSMACTLFKLMECHRARHPCGLCNDARGCRCNVITNKRVMFAAGHHSTGGKVLGIRRAALCAAAAVGGGQHQPEG
jgi:hypothetical protein